MNAALDISRLEKVREQNGKTTARCPVCAAAGNDKAGNHLVILQNGKFGCLMHPGNEGSNHRKEIFALVRQIGKQAPISKPTRQAPRTWPTAEAAAKAIAPHDAEFECAHIYQKSGEPFAVVARYRTAAGKTIRQLHPEAGGWAAGGPDGKWPLLYAEKLPGAGAVHVFEGEVKTEMAVIAGLHALCPAGGAGAAEKTDWGTMAGRDVYLWLDRDEPGEKWGATAAAILTGLTPPARVKIVRVPYEMGSHKDIADYLDDGAGMDAIEKLIAAAPEWTPPPPLPTVADTPLDPKEAAKSGKPYSMTDLGNAARLVYYYGEMIRYDVSRKLWRVWDGKRWAIDNALEVNRRAADTARKIRLEAAEAPSGNGDTKDLGASLFAHAVKSESRDRLAAMLEVAKSFPGIAVSASVLDSDPWKMNVLNGTLDLKTGILTPHDKRDLITKLAPVEYHPGLRCGRWENFLLSATGGDKQLVAFLQMVAGYTLTGLTTEEILLLVYGPEASGKTTFLEALRAILGEYARTIQADLLTKQRDSRGGGAASPELAGLAGARMAAGSEMEQGREIAEALAKNITGGESITARHLYGESFDFHPQFKLWIALNHCPKVSADDGAIWRRIVRIGFEHTVPPERRDKTLKSYLRNPQGGAPAVLAWAVEGCLRWQREGLKIPDAVARSTAAYRQESDPLAMFIADCLSFNPAAWTLWSEIWTAYNEHAAENGTPERYRVAPKRLQERLRGYDCRSERRKIGRGWQGVELQNGWKTGGGDARDARDTISKSFSSKSLLGKVLGEASPPSPPSPDDESEGVLI